MESNQLSQRAVSVVVSDGDAALLAAATSKKRTPAWQLHPCYNWRPAHLGSDADSGGRVTDIEGSEEGSSTPERGHDEEMRLNSSVTTVLGLCVASAR